MVYSNTAQKYVLWNKDYMNLVFAGTKFLIYSCNCPHHGGVCMETILPVAIEVGFLCNALPLTPGQASGLQLLVSMFPPIEEQSEPPLRGTGLVQFLVLI